MLALTSTVAHDMPSCYRTRLNNMLITYLGDNLTCFHEHGQSSILSALPYYESPVNWALDNLTFPRNYMNYEAKFKEIRKLGLPLFNVAPNFWICKLFEENNDGTHIFGYCKQYLVKEQFPLLYELFEMYKVNPKQEQFYFSV